MSQTSTSSQSVDFYFDYASPYSFFANALLSKELPGVTINYKPVYLRGFSAFREGIPFTEHKLLNMLEDCERTSNIHNLSMKLPTNFPINGLYAVRGALAAQQGGFFPAYHKLVFEAAWCNNVNISDKQTLVSLVAEIDLDPADFLDKIESAEIKALLKEETDKAVSHKIFGVPAFRIGEKLVWGSDRFDHVRWELEQAS